MHICQDVDSLRPLFFSEDEITQSSGTVIKQSIEDLKRIHAHLDSVPAIEVADAYYMKQGMVESVMNLDNVALISKMRKDAVAYKNPKLKKPGTRGAQAKIGERVKLAELFENGEIPFETKTIRLYGKERKIRFGVVDLLWNKSKHFRMRFVLVEILDADGLRKPSRLILGCTDRFISAEGIITAYAWRTKIELSFRDTLQHIGLDEHHFWSEAIPKFKPRKKGAPPPLEQLEDEHDKELAAQCLKRVETYLQTCVLAQGITQLAAQKLTELGIREEQVVYKRTYSENSVSSWVAQQLLSEIFFSSRSERNKPESKNFLTEIFEAVERFSEERKAA